MLIQTNMPPNKAGEERVIMKITGVILDMVIKLGSKRYRKHVMFEIVNKLINVVTLREICAMLL